LQKHCTKPVCHRKACRRVVQRCVVMSELLGYARVSTAEQTAALQQDALRAAGCSRIWADTASGTRTDRPQLAAVFDHLRAGDTLAVWRLDRLGRSLPHLIETIGQLEARGVGFKSVQENIDTTTPAAGWCSTSSGRWPASNGNSSRSAPSPGWPPLGSVAASAGGPLR